MVRKNLKGQVRYPGGKKDLVIRKTFSEFIFAQKTVSAVVIDSEGSSQISNTKLSSSFNSLGNFFKDSGI